MFVLHICTKYNLCNPGSGRQLIKVPQGDRTATATFSFLQIKAFFNGIGVCFNVLYYITYDSNTRVGINK